MNFSTFNLLPLLTLFLMSQIKDVNAGLLGCIGYPVSQSACNAAWVTCLSTLGLTAVRTNAVISTLHCFVCHFFWLYSFLSSGNSYWRCGCTNCCSSLQRCSRRLYGCLRSGSSLSRLRRDEPIVDFARSCILITPLVFWRQLIWSDAVVDLDKAFDQTETIRIRNLACVVLEQRLWIIKESWVKRWELRFFCVHDWNEKGRTKGKYSWSIQDKSHIHKYIAKLNLRMLFSIPLNSGIALTIALQSTFALCSQSAKFISSSSLSSFE